MKISEGGCLGWIESKLRMWEHCCNEPMKVEYRQAKPLSFNAHYDVFPKSLCKVTQSRVLLLRRAWVGQLIQIKVNVVIDSGSGYLWKSRSRSRQTSGAAVKKPELWRVQLLFKHSHEAILIQVGSRQFAIEVVQTLQSAGHQALWAGGCVRDQLLDRTPKDFDVATSANPDQVREVFGKARTLSIGASFGVITVLGPPGSGADPIEVATFRRDGGYSDGRRPDTVEFTDAKEDALRRDFTINGMFFDPVESKVIDYVGGKEDLKAQVVRAIGDPNERIEEDKLRMLRAVRFASTLSLYTHLTLPTTPYV